MAHGLAEVGKLVGHRLKTTVLGDRQVPLDKGTKFGMEVHRAGFFVPDELSLQAWPDEMLKFKYNF